MIRILNGSRARARFTLCLVSLAMCLAFAGPSYAQTGLTVDQIYDRLADIAIPRSRRASATNTGHLGRP